MPLAKVYQAPKVDIFKAFWLISRQPQGSETRRGSGNGLKLGLKWFSHKHRRVKTGPGNIHSAGWTETPVMNCLMGQMGSGLHREGLLREGEGMID